MVPVVVAEPQGEEQMRFTLTDKEREAVVALKEACDHEGVHYKSIFELAKYSFAVRSQVSDDAKNALTKRTMLAMRRLKKRRKWESDYKMDQIDGLTALKQVDEAAPELFVVRYTTDKEGHTVVAHHIAHTPYDFMFANANNLAIYMAAEQYRMDLGAADLEEARKGIAIVGVADDQWSIKAAYKYLRVLAKGSDNAKDMHPNRLRKIYAEIPILAHHLIEVGKKLLPKKIAARVNVFHTVEDLELQLIKAKKGKDPMTIVEWCERRNKVYEESVLRVTV